MNVHEVDVDEEGWSLGSGFDPARRAIEQNSGLDFIADLAVVVDVESLGQTGLPGHPRIADEGGRRPAQPGNLDALIARQFDSERITRHRGDEHRGRDDVALKGGLDEIGTDLFPGLLVRITSQHLRDGSRNRQHHTAGPRGDARHRR